MTARHPVLFIHGLWLHASSWGRWVELFAAHGYAAVAPGWPGEELTAGATRERRSGLSSYGISEVMEHFADIATALQVRPVLIGHGLGGLMALMLGGETHAAGVIAIDPRPFAEIALRTREPGGGLAAPALSRDEFRMVYCSKLSSEESDQLYERWAIPAPSWALSALVKPGMLAPRSGPGATNSSRGPTLLVASGNGSGQAAARYASARRDRLPAVSDEVIFADRGPSLVIDDGWRQVAESCLSWMDAQEL